MHRDNDKPPGLKKKPAPGHRNNKPVAGFSTLIRALVPPAAAGAQVKTGRAECSPLARLDYQTELKVKNEALARFWRQHRLDGRPEGITPSPKIRGYRTTSKRIAIFRPPTLRFLMMEDKSHPGRDPFIPSPLEPDEHAGIYRFLQKKLSTPIFRTTAEHLNYLIIRGNYRQRAVIFNVEAMNGPLIRNLKILAAHLQKSAEPVNAAFVYLAPAGSDYYLESRQPENPVSFKKLFGPASLSIHHGGRRLDFHPTAFSQVNESMIGPMVERTGKLLRSAGRGSLLDLYCGYGLFSHLLAGNYRQITGIDAEGPAIRSARENCRHAPAGVRMKFLSRRITKAVIAGLPAPPSETVLLDPPRQGPEKGVIAAIADRKPEKVLHIFCSVDQIPLSLKDWRKEGYRAERIVPLDMFPGSANLEVMILLIPA